MVLMFYAGMIASLICVVLGIAVGVKITQHSVDSYVKKLTPEDTERIYRQEPYIPEENLRALDIDEDEYKKVMGWTPQEERADY